MQVGSNYKAFTFDSPAVTVSNAKNSPTTGGAVATILGQNFGMVDYSPAVSIGDTACVTLSWVTVTTLSCAVHDGVVLSGSIRVAVDSLSGTQVGVFSYNAPVVTGFGSLANSPTSGGATTTLAGVSFGPFDSTPTVVVGSTLCNTRQWISDSSVRCNVAAGSGTGFTTALILNTQSETEIGFTYDAPVVSKVTLANVPTSSGISVTVNGLNFGQSDLKPNVAVLNWSCSQSKWISSTTVACVPLVGAGSALVIEVQVTDVAGSSGNVFTYDAPVLSYATLANGPTAGGSISTIVGMNFGYTLDGDDVFTAKVGTQSCSRTDFVTATSAACTVPASVGYANVVMNLGVLGQFGSQSNAFTYDSPKITAISPSNGPAAGGAQLIFAGSNFGATGPTPTIAIGDTSCTTSIWTADSAVRCIAPAGVSKALSVKVGANSLIGTSAYFWSYNSPVLTYAYRNTPTTGSGQVTVYGTNFGTFDPSLTATVGSLACASPVWTSNTVFTCIAPTGTGTVALSVTAGSQIGTGLSFVTYDSPVLTFLTRLNGAASGGFAVTVTGVNFGYGTAFTGLVSTGVQQQNCKKSIWVSGTAITCDFGPAGVGKGMALSTTLQGISGTGAPTFSFDSPVVTRITPNNGPTTGGAPISVFGANFGTAAASTLAGVMGTGAVLLPCASVGWVSNNVVVAQSAHGVGINADVSVGLGLSPASYAGTLQGVFNFDAPVVTGIIYATSPLRGGAVLTLIGTNFGSAQLTNNPTVSVTASDGSGQASCSSAAFVSSTAVTCLTPPGSGQQKNVQLTVGTRTGTIYGEFSYDARIVSPPNLATYYVTVGEQLKIDIIAKADDTSTAVAVLSNEGASAPSYTGTHPALHCTPANRGTAGALRSRTASWMRLVC
jgi:hypothetical protein